MRLLATLLLLTGCVLPGPPPGGLASAEIVSDFDSYTIRRAGLLPFRGQDLSVRESEELQASFFGEISAATPFQVVSLHASDLEEIPPSDPHRRGGYEPKTIIALSRRYQLDALLIGTATDIQYFAPQRLAVQMDLVAAETGLVIWSGSVHLDAAQERVQRSLRHWAETRLGERANEDWQLTLISPRRFARFAAYQLARLL